MLIEPASPCVLLFLGCFSREMRLIRSPWLSVHLLGPPPLLPVTSKLSANFSQSGKAGKRLRDIAIFMNFMRAAGNFPEARLTSPRGKAVITQPLPFLLAPSSRRTETICPVLVSGFRRVEILGEMSLETCRGWEGNCGVSDGKWKEVGPLR